jgi:hypothetical protein
MGDRSLGAARCVSLGMHVGEGRPLCNGDPVFGLLIHKKVSDKQFSRICEGEQYFEMVAFVGCALMESRKDRTL